MQHFTLIGFILLIGLTTLSAKGVPASKGAPFFVQLTTFDVRKVNGSVEIIWKTSVEKNSAYFEVQRSLDGTIWEVIQIAKSKGAINKSAVYQVLDVIPNQEGNYYRLKQVDNNDEVSYSNTLYIAQELDASLDFMIDEKLVPSTTY